MASSIWFGLAQYTQQLIQGLNLPLAAGTLPNAQVFLRRLMVDRDDPLPNVQVCPWGRETETEGSFEDLGIIYPVGVFFTTASNQDYSLTDQDIDLQWRDILWDNVADFPIPDGSFAPLAGVNVSMCEVEAMEVTEDDAWRERNLLHSGFVFNWRTLRKRLNRGP